MGKYRTKLVVKEAVQWTGQNFWGDIVPFMEKVAHGQDDKLYIYTLEGVMTASVGDWIIKGLRGEFYPCKDDIFQKTYEAVE